MKINTLKFDFIKVRFNIYKIVSYMQKFDLEAQHTIVKLAFILLKVEQLHTQLSLRMFEYLADSIGRLWVESINFDTATLLFM